jgi:serine/threonine protein phosphatase 1
MRTLVIGDIHGCSKALDFVLQLARVRKSDTLVTLGDYVDRGPDSRGVLDRLLWLQTQCRLIPVLGNHEIMMLRSRTDPVWHKDWLTHGGRNTLRSYAPDKKNPTLHDVPAEHWEFMEKCVDWHETEAHIFVHAGVSPEVAMADQEPLQLFWEFLTKQARPHISGKQVICGHTSQDSGRPLHLGHTICMDTHAYGGGFLSCMDIASGSVWQASQSGMKREFVLSE